MEDRAKVGAAFAEWNAAKEAMETAYAHRFTWPEAQSIHAAMNGEDLTRAAKARELWKAVEASHRRGDWKNPIESTRMQFKEMVLADPERRIDSPDFDVWSEAEMMLFTPATTDAANLAPYLEVREEFALAHKERRVLYRADALTSQEARNAGAPVGGMGPAHFAGESEAQAQQELAAKLTRIRNFHKAVTLAEEARNQVDQLARDDNRLFDQRALLGAIENVLIEVLDLTTVQYPYHRVPAWSLLRVSYNGLKAQWAPNTTTDLDRKVAGVDRFYQQLLEKRKLAREETTRQLHVAMAW